MTEVIRSWSSRRHTIVGALVIIGITLSALVYLDAKRNEDRHIWSEFERRAEVRTSLTRERVSQFEGALFGLSHLLVASTRVTREEFSIAAQAILARYVGISALEWIEEIPNEQRAALEAKISRELGQPFMFTQLHGATGVKPAPYAPVHYPILYVEPMEGNERAFGYDLAFGPTTKDLANARRHKQVTVSRSIYLAQETQNRRSVIFIWPVFKEFDLSQKFLGYVQGVFRLSDILIRDLQKTDGESLDILWIDPRETDPDYREIFSYRPDDSSPLHETDFNQVGSYSQKIPVGDRHWEVHYRPNPTWLAAQTTNTPLWLLLAGLVITALISTLTSVLLRRTHTVESQVITRTEELEQQRLLLAGLMQSLPGMAYRCTPEVPSTFFYVSQGALQLCGHTAEEFLNGSVHLHDFIHDKDRDGIIDTLRQALQDKQPYAVEYRITPRFGDKIKWVLDQGHGVYDQEGKLLYHEGLIIEITKQKQIEEQKLALERRLFEAHKHESLGLMAGGVAHDFNNLLTGILGHTGLARLNQPESSSIDKHLEEIEHSSQRAAELCDQMLAFAGRGRLSVETVDLPELITALKPLLRSTVNKKIDLQYQLADIPKLTGDISQIRQVILNLVINGSEAIGDQPGIITLELDSQTITGNESSAQTHGLLPGSYAALKISDTGTGIPRENLDKIFDPFFSTKFTGRGLGLAAAVGVARGHNGSLTVESEETQGSTFTLLLPLVEPSSEAPDLPPTPRKALVIDDDKPVLNVVTELLTSVGIEAVPGHGGARALDIFQAKSDSFDLVLLDIIMPGLNGPETLARLRAVKPQIPVLMMSGHHDPHLVEDLADKGPLVFINKPFTRTQLQNALKTLLAT